MLTVRTWRVLTSRSIRYNATVVWRHVYVKNVDVTNSNRISVIPPSVSRGLDSRLWLTHSINRTKDITAAFLLHEQNNVESTIRPPSHHYSNHNESVMINGVHISNCSNLHSQVVRVICWCTLLKWVRKISCYFLSSVSPGGWHVVRMLFLLLAAAGSNVKCFWVTSGFPRNGIRGHQAQDVRIVQLTLILSDTLFDDTIKLYSCIWPFGLNYH